MNVPEYIQSWFSQPHLVFKVKLKPFSLGHYILLKSVDSPFLDEGGERIIIYEDLVFAFGVCSQRAWPDAFNWANDLDACKSFYKELDEELVKQVEKLDLVISIQSLREHIHTNFKIPDYVVERENDGVESGTYWIQSVLLTLTSELNYTRSEALNAPISLAIADYCWQLEKNGLIRIMPDYLKELKQGSK